MEVIGVAYMSVSCDIYDADISAFLADPTWKKKNLRREMTGVASMSESCEIYE